MLRSFEADFGDLISRVHRGDREAAEQLIRHFEREIRVEVRCLLRARDSRLRRILDSMDICQSVMGEFWERISRGHFEVSEPAQLIRLLVGMTRKKVAERARFHRRARRDIRATVSLDVEIDDRPSTVEMPDRIAAGREILASCRDLLDESERRLTDMRLRGEDWNAIASAVGGTPDARRKQFHRAISRIVARLGGDPTRD